MRGCEGVPPVGSDFRTNKFLDRLGAYRATVARPPLGALYGVVVTLIRLWLLPCYSSAATEWQHVL